MPKSSTYLPTAEEGQQWRPVRRRLLLRAAARFKAIAEEKEKARHIVVDGRA